MPAKRRVSRITGVRKTDVRKLVEPHSHVKPKDWKRIIKEGPDPHYRRAVKAALKKYPHVSETMASIKNPALRSAASSLMMRFGDLGGIAVLENVFGGKDSGYRVSKVLLEHEFPALHKIIRHGKRAVMAFENYGKETITLAEQLQAAGKSENYAWLLLSRKPKKS